MDIVFLLVLASASGVLGVVRQLILFPARLADWRYSFAAEYGQARQALRGARLERRQVDEEQQRALREIEQAIRAAERSGQMRARSLESQRDALLHPPRGEVVASLGQLRLHRCALLVLREAKEFSTTVEEEISLDGLVVDTQVSSQNAFIILVRADGTRRTAAYPRVGYQETEVLEFVDRIHNAVVSDKALHDSREEQAAEIAAELRRVNDETAREVQEGRRRLAELKRAHRGASRRIDADTRWDAECDAWQKLTGRRPQWWWRW